jgi:hypothetical protein
MFYVRSLVCVETKITWQPFRRRSSYLYLSNTRYQLSFASMDLSKQTTKHNQTDLLQIAGPLESPPSCSDTQQDVSRVESASWHSFIPFWPVAYSIFLRTFHFSLSSSSPFPQSKSWLHTHLSPVWFNPNRAERRAHHPLRPGLRHSSNADTS